ncbi:aminotransferase-like domain-containing protein [Leptothrix discophora]|uniref:PLP-dependent aminotransferase family protein n=1 Tax=Leptothrix discophora TaxID=89 RepID=A0ABT9G485_LEPDI|nr:PLP-dependent aminotransferase family protein [Leptothrix discophora]MDP4301303.1 PLP-dependent aminotransferase family protein [Leptothrix discophora]
MKNDLPLSAAPLTRHSGQTLSEQLASQVADRIRQRLLGPGARLPSVRDAARRHGVSPHTVVAAYDQLLAQGLVEARKQRGFFVRGPQPDASTPRSRSSPAAGPGPQDPHTPRVAPIDATALIRGMFQAGGGRPGPGLGTLPATWLDLPLLHGALRRVLADDRHAGAAASSLLYGEPAGDRRLREALSVRLQDLGIPATPASIVTAVGATHALDLVSRTLLAPGDAVLIDDPGWAVESARLSRQGLRLLPVPRDAEGPDLAVLEALAREHRPRLYVTVSVLHNPTGHTLGLHTAHRLLQLAQAHDFLIAEDDTYAYLAPPHAPRLSALDGLQRTVYVSGFSKILAPSWRVGYLAAPAGLVERLIDAKMLSTLTSPALLEQAVAVCLEQGLLRRHAEKVDALLASARGRSVRLAESAGCRFITPPQGLFGWVDTGVDTERLALPLLDAGWLIAPGSLFHAHRRPSTAMRINFASSQDAAFWKAFTAARSTMKNAGSGPA